MAQNERLELAEWLEKGAKGKPPSLVKNMATKLLDVGGGVNVKQVAIHFNGELIDVGHLKELVLNEFRRCENLYVETSSPICVTVGENPDAEPSRSMTQYHQVFADHINFSCNEVGHMLLKIVGSHLKQRGEQKGI